MKHPDCIVTEASLKAAPTSRHIGTWDGQRWRPWCEVDALLLPEVCGDCLALAEDNWEEDE